MNFRAPLHRTSPNHPKVPHNKGAGGDQSPGAEPVGGSPMKRRGNVPASDELQIEAMERLDGGDRLALAQMRAMEQELLSIAGSPSGLALDPVAAKGLSSDLLDIQATVIRAGARLPITDPLQRRFNDLLNEVISIGAVLSERSS